MDFPTFLKLYMWKESILHVQQRNQIQYNREIRFSMQCNFGSVQNFETLTFLLTELSTLSSLKVTFTSFTVFSNQKSEVKIHCCVKLVRKKNYKTKLYFGRYGRSFRCVNSRKTRVKQTPFLRDRGIAIEQKKKFYECLYCGFLPLALLWTFWILQFS